MLETVEKGKQWRGRTLVVLVMAVVAVVVTGQIVDCLLDSLHLIIAGSELDDTSIKMYRRYLFSGWRLKLGHYGIPLHL
jgi:hypothetical protein